MMLIPHANRLSKCAAQTEHHCWTAAAGHPKSNICGSLTGRGVMGQAVLTASNAAIGGPTTSAAMASARGWTSMVQPAILTGTLGYAVGSGVGYGIGQLLLTWPAPALL